MKKKGIIILACVLGLIAVGAVLSAVIDWPVDTSKSSGDIAKSSRFSRKTAEEGLSNLEELLQNDESYKDGLVAANLIMQTRAQQFETLVSLSNETAGDIEAFADVLKDMNVASPMIANVSALLAEAGSDLNAALRGAQTPDLAQNTINASLAYTTLQKQNSLADRFITTADAYLKDATGDDQLKFVRDQWVDYQRMSAALDGDAKKAAQLEEKGYQLTGEESIAALNKIPTMNRMVVMMGAEIAQSMDVGNEIATALPPELVGRVFTVLCEAAQMTVEQTGIQAIKHGETMKAFQNTFVESMNELIQAGKLSEMETGGKLGDFADVGTTSEVVNVIKIAREEVMAAQPDGKPMGSGPDVAGFKGGGAVATLNLIELGASPAIVTNFNEVVKSIRNVETGGQIGRLPALGREIGQIISFTAVGQRPELNVL